MSLKRIFVPGDEWLYYKIYCGARTADGILTETIRPLTKQLLKEAFICKWFFIRYKDPEFHLRIRFLLADTASVGSVILEVYKALEKDVASDVIYKIQTDTYLREVERYGARTMVLSETLFYCESTMLLEAMEAIADEKLYFLFVLKAIDQLLDAFAYAIGQKLELVVRNTAAFKREFHADKRLNRLLDKKYRSLKDELSVFLDASSAHKDYALLDEILKDRTAGITVVIADILKYQKDKLLEVPLDDLVSSYIHMLVNRAFRSKQRFYELVCYAFLKQYYTTLKIQWA